MIIIGVDYHPSFQQIAFMDEKTGEYGERQLNHSNGEAEKFYRELQHRGVHARVGMEATGHALWLERLLAELGVELWIGDPAEIKTKRVRKKKTDREDARLMLRLLLENRFPKIWVPSPENRDLRQLLWHRHRLVQMRTRIMNQLQAVAMNEGYRWKKKLFSEKEKAVQRKGTRPARETLVGSLGQSASQRTLLEMEASRSPQAVPADYTSGTASGSRPGHINVNEYDPLHRLLLNAEAIAYHEGIPGHHLQLSIAEELEGLPEFRRYEGYMAFVEGWALYSERLGKEVGMYQDPYSNYGRLENEMWRAIRLVVDTGVHSKHGTRQQMVDYFHKYTAMDEPNVQTEVDRYIAWPAQALAYKLGQLEILKLRQLAKDALGERFDIRAFHDEVLDDGALPLNVLDAQVTDWVNTQKSAMK